MAMPDFRRSVARLVAMVRRVLEAAALSILSPRLLPLRELVGQDESWWCLGDSNLEQLATVDGVLGVLFRR